MPFLSLFLGWVFQNPLLFNFVPSFYIYCAPLVMLFGIVTLVHLIIERSRLCGKRWAIDNIVLTLIYLSFFYPLSIKGPGWGGFDEPHKTLRIFHQIIEEFHHETGCYPAHLTDLTQSDPAKVRIVTPNPTAMAARPACRCRQGYTTMAPISRPS